MKSRRVLLLVLLIAAGAGGYWWFYLHKPAGGPLILQGNVEVRQVNLGFKVAGRIEKLNVDEGDVVSPGETLASLEKIYFTDALAQTRAQRDQMAANYDKLRNGNRPEEIAQAKALVAEREATLTNARVMLKRAQTLLSSPCRLAKSAGRRPVLGAAGGRAAQFRPRGSALVRGRLPQGGHRARKRPAR